jgi:PAS domain S-box-containing protein
VVQRLLNFFVTERVRAQGLEAERRASLTVVSCCLTAAVAIAIALLQFCFGVSLPAEAALACAGVALALPFGLRRSGAWRAVGAVLCGAVWLAAFAVALATGGELSASLFWLVFAPALAAVLLGPRASMGLGAISVLAVAVIYVLRANGFEFPLRVEHDVAITSTLRGALLFVVALGGLVVAYEWLRGELLRASEVTERRFRALADHGVDVIVEVDERGEVVFSGRNAPPEVVSANGTTQLGLVHPDDREEIEKALQALASQRSVRVGPLRWTERNGAPVWFETAITRYEAAPNRTHLITVARDVTERVELEQQLRQSQKLTLIGQLAGGAAHDFNNLLMVISGYAESLRARIDPSNDPEATLAVEQIRQAADQGADLTRRLVALSRPVAIQRRALDVNRAIADLERMLRRLLGDDIRLELALGRELPRVRADAGELEQVLVNLALNARAAMPRDGRVCISTESRDDAVRIQVRDAGVGMDEATRARIFEAFFSTRTESGGTGLGLFVVDSIVRDLGGSIHVETAPQRGTAVTVVLPALRDTREVPIPSERPTVRGGSERILVVEDREETRRLITRALERAGYRVAAAADGRSALELAARESQFDLVVTDVLMPEIGGEELVRRLRWERPGLRVLFVSGHPQDLGDLDVLAPGARLLHKPFGLSALLRGVRELLDAA